MAATFGSSGPSQVILNLDSLFGTSLAAYNKTLVDNIGATNAFLHYIIASQNYESQDGGAYIQTPLMYELGTMDSYDGYDTLSTAPMDGITDAIAQWRQLAVPIAYSIKEVKLNKQRIVDLVKARIKQAEMGIQEGFAQALLYGTGDAGGSLATPKTSVANGSSNIDPLGLLVKYDPTTATSVDNIAQNTYSWWQNKKKESAATTTTGLLQEFMNIYNTVSLGTGGEPELVLCDQVTYELLVLALYNRFRQTQTDTNFPFQNTVYQKAKLVFDDKVGDWYTDTSSAATYGTALFLNMKFFKLKYESESDFQMLKDENGKTFQKPIAGDSRVGHIGWMGNTMITNRRKQGVLGKIARTLTVS